MHDLEKDWYEVAQQLADLNAQDRGWKASKWRTLKVKLQHIEAKMRVDGYDPPERSFWLI